jgi:serine protease Do
MSVDRASGEQGIMLRRLVLCSMLLACGFLAGLVLTGRMRSASDGIASTTPNLVAAPAAAPASPPGPQGLPAFTTVAERAINSVTNISSLRIVRRQHSPFANDPFFRYFFGDADELFGGRSRAEASLGSGVIVSSDGYILTNSHVVGQETQGITVALADRRELRAEVVGLDSWTDVALLKVDARDLPTMAWGDSSRLRVAEWVLAIGNPFQLNQTVTLGIVSALGRANVGVAAYEDFIQTDAAINPGNSGGALINAVGELVGINTAIYSESGGYQGIGFAIPSNLARRVMDDLIKHGEVRRGSIGYVEIAPVTTQLAEELGARSTRGALVSRMRRDSAAYQAGVRPGDIIVGFDGRPVEDPSHFLRLLSDARIGSAARLTIVRGGREVSVEVPISRAPTRRQSAR